MRCLLVAVAACGPPVTVHPERAAPTCGGDIVLAKQGDVTELAGCKHVRSLRITGDVVLEPLGRLAEIEGDLVVRGATLRELALPRLVAVGGSIVIADNAALTRIALPALTRTGGFEVTGNPELAALEKASSVTVVVRDNPKLPAQ